MGDREWEIGNGTSGMEMFKIGIYSLELKYLSLIYLYTGFF